MKVLVTGRDGQLARSLGEAGARWNADVRLAGRAEVDIRDPHAVVSAIDRERPDIVVNAAAFTQVDLAETEPAIATAVNGDGAENVARACAARDIPVIQMSTDYVFDGRKAKPYVEDDPVGPINVYGRSKLQGEARVATACPRHLILRTSWVYSPWGSNFVRTMLRLATERAAVRVVDDQWGCPTYAPHLADAILGLAQRALAGGADMRWGVYHAAGAGETSWCGFAREIFRVAEAVGLPAVHVSAIATADYPTPARRPLNSRLDCGRLATRFAICLPQWQSGVEDCVARIAAQ